MLFSLHLVWWHYYVIFYCWHPYCGTLWSAEGRHLLSSPVCHLPTVWRVKCSVFAFFYNLASNLCFFAGLAAALGGFISYSGGIDMANVVWVPAIECLTRLWPLIFFWSAYATSLMMLVLSLDRLTSVAIPLAYYRLGVSQVMNLLSP